MQRHTCSLCLRALSFLTTREISDCLLTFFTPDNEGDIVHL